MKNMLKRKPILFMLALAFFSLVFTTCNNPLFSGAVNGSVTVSIGGNNSRSAIPWANSLDSDNLVHIITLSNGPNTAPPPKTIPAGGGTVKFLVTPGQWKLTVEAFYSDELIAINVQQINVISGSNNNISVMMKEPADFPIFTVTFDSMGGDLVSDQYVKKYQKAQYVTPPARVGFEFDGWYIDTDFTEPYNFDSGVTADITLYAKWIVEMVSISAGTFSMGSPMTEPNIDSGETQHSVTLSAFSMSKYQVTQEQYQAVMGSNPSYFSSSPQAGETQGKRPVECVSWYDTLVFCNKLSIAEGLTPAYSISGETNPADWGAVPTSSNATWDAAEIVDGSTGYRLPTEAQWEYACRAGTTTAYNTGDTISDDTGWYESNSGSNTHEVGKKPANTWGLYDMHGNVWEWCWDWYDSSYYSSSPTNDPLGASSGAYRVGRGGGWDTSAENLRSAYRGYNYPDGGYYSLGFRLVRP